MPGIKIYRKSRLKNKNTEKTTTTEVSEVDHSEHERSSGVVSIPEKDPQPYVLTNEDIVGDNYYEDFPSHLKGNQQIFI